MQITSSNSYGESVFKQIEVITKQVIELQRGTKIIIYQAISWLVHHIKMTHTVIGMTFTEMNMRKY